MNPRNLLDSPITAIPTVIIGAIVAIVGIASSLFVIYKAVVWMGT